mgnify:CR=1 FL=1
MNIENAPRPSADKGCRKNTHEPGERHNIGVMFADDMIKRVKELAFVFRSRWRQADGCNALTARKM